MPHWAFLNGPCWNLSYTTLHIYNQTNFVYISPTQKGEQIQHTYSNEVVVSFSDSYSHLSECVHSVPLLISKPITSRAPDLRMFIKKN